MTQPDPKIYEDLFGPVSVTVEVEVLGKKYLVPDGLPVLRALQYIELIHQGLTINYSKLCWNNRCHTCLVEYETRKGNRKIFEACQLVVWEGMKITDIPLALNP